MTNKTDFQADAPTTHDGHDDVEALPIGSFDEHQTPEAAVVSLGAATYAKGIGKVYAA